MKQYLHIEGQEQPLLWQSEHQAKLPKQCVCVDDSLTAEKALNFARNGTAMLWQGDYHNAKQLLSAMARHIDKKKKKKTAFSTGAGISVGNAHDRTPSEIKSVDSTRQQSHLLREQFNLYRLRQAQKAQILSMLLVRVNYVNTHFMIPLRRSPEIDLAIKQVCSWQEDFVISLRELLGIIGAYEWRKKGVDIAALGQDAKIYPFYGVFSPIRGEYLALVAQAPLPSQTNIAIEIGCGTGVLAAIVAKRGFSKVVVTDISKRAIECATYNLQQLGLNHCVEVRQHAFFPPESADLIICNPPWLPAKASTSLEAAVYDPDSQMLKGYLSDLVKHLNPDGEGWLIMSNLAELLGLRGETQLEDWISTAGLRVKAKYDTQAQHKKARDGQDILAEARQQEVTSLWVLVKA
ncbi:methylase [Pelistega indica]|uniref:Methylase n=1 Tax=Pelistega indica TaxID=1414851 RepID=V8G7S5_9BURK|nr:methyltransferase [Pelistega indica]ETD72584.1 methylase [Pelistega indica]